MEFIAIVFLVMTFAIVFTFGKMMYLDLKDLFEGFCFNPGKFTFKDQGGRWELIECERKARFHPLTHACNHESNHNLTTYNKKRFFNQFLMEEIKWKR